MNNPYQPPTSDIATGERPSKTKWKVLFWVILVLEIIGLGLLAFDSETPFTELFFDVTIYGLILLGLFGFAFDRRLLFRQFWLVVVLLGICYDSYTIYSIDWTFESQQQMLFVIGVSAIVLGPLLIAQYLALCLYAVKSPDIWGG